MNDQIWFIVKWHRLGLEFHNWWAVLVVLAWLWGGFWIAGVITLYFFRLLDYLLGRKRRD